MTKPKAKTIQQRFGFADTDLRTPKHDEIMLWLDQNIVSVIKELGFTKIKKSTVEWARKEGCPESLIREALDSTAKSINDMTWEFPIKSRKSDFIIGFIDLRILFGRPSLHLWEKRGWALGSERECLYFEVKSKIESLGEVIRQIRMYQEYTNGRHIHYDMWPGYYVIVCPDDTFKDALRSQGIYFVKYQPTDI